MRKRHLLLLCLALAGAPAWALEKATFAGGCFWCMQPPFDQAPGVLKTTVGYTGGSKVNPTYHEVSDGRTGHAESIEVEFDPTKTTYRNLLKIFWRNVDPFTPNAQFCDHGNQYRTAIFYHDENQKKQALASKSELESSGRFKKPIVTEIVAASAFYPAEEYHQSYHKKNPIRYKFYRFHCGRDERLGEIWGSEAGAH